MGVKGSCRGEDKEQISGTDKGQIEHEDGLKSWRESGSRKTR